jgi:predicted LPLAT superfamily acyltransferase
MHSSLAVTTEGLPLGLAAVKFLLFVLVAYRLLVRGSGRRLHRDWFQRSTLGQSAGRRCRAGAQGVAM